MAEPEDQADLPNRAAQAEPPSFLQPANLPSVDGPAVYDRFLEEAHQLVKRLQQRDEEFLKLAQITEHVNRGNTLEQVLENLYEEAKSVIPYHRIGFSLIDRTRGVVVARWARSAQPLMLAGGYESPLAGSTLQQIVDSAKPRIINDLEAYLRAKPTSESTALLVREGIRSSLTCPLIVQNVPVGFLFFSSARTNTYSNVHVAFFQQIAAQLATTVEKGRLYSELAEQKAIVEKQNQVMANDMALARQVQQALVPRAAPVVAGIEIAFAYEPAVQVGGDILDLVPLADGRMLFFIGDAMGHGVRAALLMSIVKTALHAALRTDPRPAAVLADINRVLARFFNDYFVTAACCVLDPRTLRGEFAVAGHAGPLWFRAKTEDVVRQGAPSLPLGIVDGTKYETTPLALDPGDAIVFSTDGIAEAFDLGGVQYSAERLEAQLLRRGAQCAQEVCAGVRGDLELHCKDCVRQDDLTLLVVKAAGSASAVGGVA